jgi:membrane protease YdiL (CAAX protease family)
MSERTVGRDPTGLDQVRSIGLGIGLVVLAFLSGTILAFIVAQLGLAAGLPLRDDRTLQVVVLLPAQFVGFLLPLFGYLASEDRLDLIDVRVPTLRDIGWAIGGIVALLVGVIILSQLIQYANVSPASNGSVETAQQNPEIIPFFVIMSILIVGPCEELLFRGGVQGLLRDSYATVPAIVITSGLFGVAHVAALLGDAVLGQAAYILVTFVLGIVLGLLYEYTENIVVPMLSHGIYNAIVFGSLAVA